MFLELDFFFQNAIGMMSVIQNKYVYRTLNLSGRKPERNRESTYSYFPDAGS